MIQLRDWQKAAIQKHLGGGDVKRHWLTEAPPGAGKTTYTLETIRRMLLPPPRVARLVKRAIVVVPSTHLKKQWALSATSLGVKLNHRTGKPSRWLNKGWHGCVVTYDEVAANPMMLTAASAEALVVLDEIHHAGEGATWGDSLMSSFGRAKYVLGLSGTPFRTDSRRIPFVSYNDQGYGQPDYTYRYVDALDDKVVRPVTFLQFSGEVSARGESFHMGAMPTEKEAARRLKIALEPSNGWIDKILIHAHDMVMELRKEQPDAAGIITCVDTDHAAEVAKRMKKVLGVAPVIVTSKDSASSKRIEDFGKSDDRWIVSVRMISEGVDIPRLRVGVYLTNITTAMYFRQFTGRVCRVIRRGAPAMAYVYVPSDSRIVKLAKELMQQQRHHAPNRILTDARSAEVAVRESMVTEGGAAAPPMVADPESSEYEGGASVSELQGVRINGGQMVLLPEFAPQMVAADVHRAIGRHIETPVVETPVPLPVAAALTADDYSAEIKRLVGQVVRKDNLPHSHVYGSLNKRQGVRSQASCSIPQLAARVKMLRQRLYGN